MIRDTFPVIRVIKIRFYFEQCNEFIRGHVLEIEELDTNTYIQINFGHWLGSWRERYDYNLNDDSNIANRNYGFITLVSSNGHISNWEPDTSRGQNNNKTEKFSVEIKKSGNSISNTNVMILGHAKSKKE